MPTRPPDGPPHVNPYPVGSMVHETSGAGRIGLVCAEVSNVGIRVAYAAPDEIVAYSWVDQPWPLEAV